MHSMDPSTLNAGQQSDSLRQDMLLEDYRLWLRELEKPDRWLHQGIWTVLAASAAALYFTKDLQPTQQTAATAMIILVALVFISLNGRLLATRIASYRMISKRVAAVRKSANVLALLGAEEYRASGAPLLSDSPELFVRTALAGRAPSYRSLYHLHLLALAATSAVALLYCLERWSFRAAGGYVALAGLVHLLVFSLRFRYRAAEAENVAAFIVTNARDKRVAVARDAEARLNKMIRVSGGSTTDAAARRAVQVVVAYEDRRFRYHCGVDVVSVLAVLTRRRRVGGASTIAMQVARQLIPSPLSGALRQHLRRKKFEAMLGMWLVVRYGRRRVLRMWLDNVPFGTSRILGLAKAAERYLNKTVAELDELDGLLLAERATVYTGRYYPERVRKLANWAVNRGLMPNALLSDVNARVALMQARVPVDTGSSSEECKSAG